MWIFDLIENWFKEKPQDDWNKHVLKRMHNLLMEKNRIINNQQRIIEDKDAMIKALLNELKSKS